MEEKMKQKNVQLDAKISTQTLLEKAGYQVRTGTRIVSKDLMGLADIKPDGSVCLRYYEHESALAQQLKLRNYLVDQGISCTDEGADKIRSLISERYSLIGDILKELNAI
jgi:hypothetical protein